MASAIFPEPNTHIFMDEHILLVEEYLIEVHSKGGETWNTRDPSILLLENRCMISQWMLELLCYRLNVGGTTTVLVPMRFTSLFKGGTFFYIFFKESFACCWVVEQPQPAAPSQHHPSQPEEHSQTPEAGSLRSQKSSLLLLVSLCLCRRTLRYEAHEAFLLVK